MLSSLFSGPLPVGSKAPAFRLPDEVGNVVELSKLRGQNVVLVFYPMDETSTCRAQLCEFRDRWEQAQSRNVLVFGVNPGKAGGHAAFRANNKLPFPLLVDTGQKVASLYKSRGLLVRRTVYLIGPEGTIRYAKRGKPAVEEVLSASK